MLRPLLVLSLMYCGRDVGWLSAIVLGFEDSILVLIRSRATKLTPIVCVTRVWFQS